MHTDFKTKTCKIIDNINPEDYKEEYIGKFLREVKKETEDLRKIWSGTDDMPTTLNIKSEFSRNVLEKTYKEELTWKDFSKNTRVKSLTKEIYDFIKNS